MPSKIFSGFDWDEGNLEKCQKHGVAIEEIKSVFVGTPAIGRMRHIQGRSAVFGDRDGAKRPVRVSSFPGASGTDSLYQRPLHARQGGAAL